MRPCNSPRKPARVHRWSHYRSWGHILFIFCWRSGVFVFLRHLFCIYTPTNHLPKYRRVSCWSKLNSKPGIAFLPRWSTATVYRGSPSDDPEEPGISLTKRQPWGLSICLRTMHCTQCRSYSSLPRSASVGRAFFSSLKKTVQPMLCSSQQ